MKKKLQISIIALLACICVSFAYSQNPDDAQKITIIRSGSSPVHIHRAPSSNPLVFDCTVLCGQGIALLSASHDCEANVEVCNLTTGHTEDYDTVLCASPLMIPLSGEGQYSITITLISGQIYEGEFEI